MIVHCNRSFRPEEILFLYDTQEYSHRRLEAGVCPGCNHFVARFVQTRIFDGYVVDETVSRRKANRLIAEHEKDVQYSSLDVINKNKTLYGFRYGENKEVRDRTTGEIKVVQKACDFYGNKEIIKTT